MQLYYSVTYNKDYHGIQKSCISTCDIMHYLMWVTNLRKRGSTFPNMAVLEGEEKILLEKDDMKEMAKQWPSTGK